MFWYPKNSKPGHYKCDICEEETYQSSEYYSSHIIPIAHCKRLQEARKSGYRRLPTTLSYVYNGLFLCRLCNNHFEDHYVTLLGNGTIVTNESASPWEKYQPLNRKKVKWHKLIDTDIDWPTSQTLVFRNTLVPVCSLRRARTEFFVDADDI